MKITSFGFISTGGVFDYQLGNSSFYLKTDLGNILIDCGYTIYASLVEKELINSIDYILLTHLHGDHVGSIHPLILHLKNKIKKTPRIIYPSESFKAQIYDYLKTFLINVDEYVDFVSLDSISGLGFIDTTNCHVTGMTSFAYFFEEQDRIIFLSGDLGDIEITKTFLKLNSSKQFIVFHEVSFINGNAHVFYKQLEEISSNYTIYAYHCNHLLAPNDCTLQFVANSKEYVL